MRWFATGTQRLSVLARVVPAMLLFTGLLFPPASAASRSAPDKSPNVRLLEHFAFAEVPEANLPGATGMAFHGRYAYVTGGSGLHIFDLATHVPQEIAFLRCPEAWPDIAWVRPGLVALSFFNNRKQCGRGPYAVHLVDISQPAHPVMRGSVEVWDGSLAIAAHPNGRLLYASFSALEPLTRVSIIDVSDPDEPKILRTIEGGLAACADITFSFTRRGKLAFCATGLYGPGTEIWDLSDPLEPKTIGTIVNPLVDWQHSAVATDDGKYLAVSEDSEACGPTEGAVWFYDITDPANPVLVSWFDMPTRWLVDPDDRTPDHCSPYKFSFIPDTYKMTVAWWGAGMNVIDFSEPATPDEIAHYVDADVEYWSAQFYRGRVFVSDINRGLDVFKVKGL